MRPLTCIFALILTVCLADIIRAQDIFDTSVMQVDIRFERMDWRDYLLNAKKTGDNRRLKAVVTIDSRTYQDVQVRFKGNSSFFGAVKAGYKKIPFNLKLEGDSTFAGGYETFKLSNNFRDPTALRERLGYAIAGTYVPVPKCNSAVVTVNGEYLGVYTATEGITREMVSRYFCGRKKSLIQCEPDFNAPVLKGCPKGSYASLQYLGNNQKCYERLYEVKNPALWDDLIRLMRVMQDSVWLMEDVFDVHLALWMHALNNTLVNLDSYLGYFSHNYYLFLDESGMFHPLLWDLNLAFGGFKVIKPGVELDLAEMSPMIHERLNIDNRPMLTSLLDQQKYSRIYCAMIKTILQDWCVNGLYLEHAKALQAEIGPYVRKEEATFFEYADFMANIDSVYQPENGTRSIPGIAELMSRRTAYLSAHPLLQSDFLDVNTWKVEERTDDRVKLSISVPDEVTHVRVWVRATDCSEYRYVDAVFRSESNVYAVEFPSKAHAFYFELSGQTAANLWPLQAPGMVLQLAEIGG